MACHRHQTAKIECGKQEPHRISTEKNPMIYRRNTATVCGKSET
ncbi:hypothetical protein RSSM_05425 [Rhodopirellula sallentina SM41]|uniref:Uncharacterized protein n=1 Tax=Rhodopirellula sallentina SM41 TaxID=1263870 RepID=M5UAW3_9BACT|nr:hypothetical protein RSSM_05425 [Rhodopirellula sallentina SM41]